MIPPLAALFAWPAVMAVLFSRYALPTALLASMFGGYLLLPTGQGLDLPLLPALDKHTIPALMALALVMARQGDPAITRPGWLPTGLLVRLLLLLLVAGAFLTVLTNSDPISFATGGGGLPALRLYDSFSVILTAIMQILPLLLARRYLSHPDTQRLLLVAFCIAGLVYSLPALYEIRMSPQLNRMLYGYFPHSWQQHIRGGGFRPIVFLHHGLWLSLFFSGATLAALALWRSSGADRWRWLAAGCWLLVTLLLSKSLGALSVTLLLGGVVLLLPFRSQFLVAAVISGIILAYPVLRGAGMIPIDRLMSISASINVDRSMSLGVRVANEERLLAKAQQRPLFGWGGWGRARLYTDDGRDDVITDGYWVITIGEGGWTRYIGEFGLLGLPLLVLAMRQRRYQIGVATAGVAILLAGNLIDLIPNAGITPLTWLMAGSLWGRLEWQRLSDTAQPEDPAIPVAPDLRRRGKLVPAATSVYTRQQHRSPRRSRPAR